MSKKNFRLFSFLFLCFCFFVFPHGVEALDNSGYGLVNFNTKTCNLNTSYTVADTGKSGYLNGCSAADGVFLGYNEDQSQVKFMLGGVTGWVPAYEVEVVELNSDTYDIYYTSFYRVRSGELQHCINYGIYSYGSYSCITIDRAPASLSEGGIYFSYDGHYFYPESLYGFQLMTNDYRSGSRGSATNSGQPFYQYYQYLSHRTLSNYTSTDFNQYIMETGYSSKPVGGVLGNNQSQLYGEGISFVQYQSEFGANAGLVFGLAINESGWGRSPISLASNNIFGHAAYDIAPGANASSYISVAQGIYVHANNYVSVGYLDPCDGSSTYVPGFQPGVCLNGRYHGSHLGNKNSGMNVSYASDPFWGEKAAANYYALDKRYGFQDYGKYKIGIKASSVNYSIHKEANSASTILYQTGSIADVPFIILDTVHGEMVNGSDVWYKVQTDPVLDASRSRLIQDNGYYNYANNYGYIHEHAISLFISQGQASRNLYTITFDANGGVFPDGISGRKYLTVEEYRDPEIMTPSKDGYRFVGWSSPIGGAVANTTYVAQYESLIPSYQITFDANGGVFPDGTIGKKVISVDGGKTPSVAAPMKAGYEFIGWSPNVVSASGDATYVAQYKVLQVDPVDVGGEFYFHELTERSGQVYLKGYSTIAGVNHSSCDGTSYTLELVNVNSNEVVRKPLSCISDVSNMPFSIPSMNGYQATYSWFDGSISFDDVKAGEYQAYVIAKNGNQYSRKLLRNLLGKSMLSSIDTSSGQVWFRNNYYVKTVPIEIFVRDQKVAVKNNNPIDNMITGYSSLSFAGNQLQLRGFAHSVNGNYGVNAMVQRKIVFENVSSYETFTFDLNTITTGDYLISLRVSDGFDKTKAWFEGSMDLSQLPKGVYVMYIVNDANISDFAELNDIFGKNISACASMNGKNYSFQVNSDRRYRVELVIS